MEQLALTIAISVVAFLILYFVFLWDKKEHIFLRLLGSFFFVFLLILVPKTAIDYKQDCEFVRVNETVSGAITSYEYDYVCVNNTSSTAVTFHKTYMRFVYVFGFYIFMYVIYVLLLKNNEKFERLLEQMRRKLNRGKRQ